MAAGRNNRRRRRGRSRLGLLLKLLCAVTAVAALTVGATVFFQVEEIQVNGNRRYTQEEIIAATGVRLGDNLYGLNKSKISGDLLHKLPYIEGANIRRSLPSTLVIHVNELGAAAQLAVAPPYVLPEPEEGEEPTQDPPKSATEPWLINVRGKLLETAAPDSEVMLVTGLTCLDPVAGGMLTVPEVEIYKKEALLGLLDALEQLGRTELVSSVDLHPSWMELCYDDRFTVRMPSNRDFIYKLNVLDQVVERTVEKHGPQAGGHIDLTREDYDAVYAPDAG